MALRMIPKPDDPPTLRRISRARLGDRAIDELLGLCKGVAADSVINQAEAAFLLQWLTTNRQASRQWPANVLYDRIRAMLADHVLDAEEQQELLTLLHDLTGDSSVPAPSGEQTATTLPLDHPAPTIRFQGRAFCFTGQFLYGPRRECEAVIERLGGLIQKAPTYQTHYLVIGTLGTADWIHSTYGRKIEAAVALRDRHRSIAIISEQHWATFVESAQGVRR